MVTKVVLDEKEMPRQWYNLAADLPTPMQPPLGPDGKPISAGHAGAGVPDEPDRAGSEHASAGSTSPRRSWTCCASGGRRRCSGPCTWKRPSAPRPASTTRTRASRPPGSHKPNTAVPQAWYNKQFGIKRLTTETGAGQWGSALAFACSLIGLECKVFMVRDQLRPEAVPQAHDADLGRRLRRQPEHARPRPGAQILARHPGHAGQPGHRHQRGDRGGGHRPDAARRATPRAAC